MRRHRFVIALLGMAFRVSCFVWEDVGPVRWYVEMHLYLFASDGKEGLK